jgi:hypothetical protein
MHTKFWWESLRGRERFEELDVYRRIILKRILRKVVDWIHAAQDRDQWRAVVNTIMNLRVP